MWIVTGRALFHSASSATPSSFGSPSTLLITSVSRVAQSVAATAAVTATPTPAAISSGFGLTAWVSTSLAGRNTRKTCHQPPYR